MGEGVELDNAETIGHAEVTRAHLVRLGLAEDRLNLEIVRVQPTGLSTIAASDA